MATIKITKVKQAVPPIVRPVNEKEFFAKKAAEARIFLERNPIPEELLRRGKK